MLPTFYQSCLKSQRSDAQFITLEILVERLQQDRRIPLERLATLFPQPILFASRRGNLQRFLSLPQIAPEALWFPMALLHKYLKPLCSKDRQLESLIEKSLRSKAFGRNTE
jgi:hypothetical protein